MSSFQKTYEADNTSGKNHEGADANKPVTRLTATSIIGDDIENTEGENLGSIEDLMINIHSGEIEYVVIEFGSVLGLGGKLFAVPFSELRLDEEKEVFILDRDDEYLKNAPGFDKDHWPDTNDHNQYLANVSSYYNASTPGFI